MRDIGTLAAMWRYPVKSLAAQPLDRADVAAGGIPGDRSEALFVESGHARAGKPYRGKEHNLLHTIAQPQAGIDLAARAGVALTLRAGGEAHYFDDAPISVVFDRWIAEVEGALGMALDPLRWRPNFYARAAGDFDLLEGDLIGESIIIDGVVLRVRDTIKRCVTITYDIATGDPDEDVLLYIAQKRANVMGVYCDVELAGSVRVGDALRLRDL